MNSTEIDTSMKMCLIGNMCTERKRGDKAGTEREYERGGGGEEDEEIKREKMKENQKGGERGRQGI